MSAVACQALPASIKPKQQTNDEWLADYSSETKVQPAPHVSHLEIIETDNGNTDIEIEAIVPNGKYTVRYLGYCTYAYKSSGKIRMRFAISEGEYHGISLEAHRNVELKGPSGKNGKFSVKGASKFLREFATVFPDRKHLRKDRVSPQAFKDIDLRAVAKEVGKDGQGYEIPHSLRYSVIDRIIGRKKEQ